MTSSTTDLTGHPDVAEISDLTEGLLPPSRTADVRRHLGACGLCADVHASLEEIRGLLGTLPGPPRMPDDVAGRIDAALAAQALLDADAAADADAEREDPADVSRETSAATGRPSGHARAATTGPGRKNRTRSGRRRVAALGTALAAAALGLGAVIVSSVDDGGSPDDPGQRAALADTFSEGKLERQVTGLLLGETHAQSNRGRTPGSLGVESESSTGNRVFQQPTVPDCVQRGIGREDAALATEEGVYQNREALLVVLPAVGDDSRVTAYLVETACVRQPSLGPGKVLLESTYARS
ncbi:hypothetical protein [Streptomyces ziwulingensis]|uniref:Zinc-finger domain-containing protein n=1 Tax=Streptomyces ziwulingensis TaxID=1045501 RepID=A0ABP9BHV2_9ACTN